MIDIMEKMNYFFYFKFQCEKNITPKMEEDYHCEKKIH